MKNPPTVLRPVAAAAIVAALCAGGWAWHTARQSVTPQVAAGLEFADSLDRRPATHPVAESEALAALYVERARLGVGSPFRLIDQALNDPLLTSERRRQVGYAILGRTAEGMVYSSPAEALDLVSTKRGGLGLAHRNFIEGVIDSARDPRAAELALRLAFQVTASSGVTSPRAAVVALAAIAQARDRTLARRDAYMLLAAARRWRRDPVSLVPEWRMTRRFAVERPLIDPATASQEREASTLLSGLISTLDTIRAPVPRTRREHSLGPTVAAIAARIAVSRKAPPSAPVVVTMGGFATYVTAGGRTPSQRAARGVFVARARSEELLVAEYARLREVEPSAREAALSVVTAAVAMRPYAQERPWFPGDDGPTPADLEQRHRLKAVEFDASVPVLWRGYYTRMFDGAVRDMGRVFPKFSVDGLVLRFGPSPLKERALALHDPRTRTVYFPVETSAGAIAHELSHDLDWQAARRRYGSLNSYRTDRSMRQYRDGLAATLDRMAGSPGPGRGNARTAPGGDRPTEAFARRVDWIVAAALARQGVVNGYLSAVQDEWLTGYASAAAPRRDTPREDATMAALREIAEVAPEVVTWFEEAYGAHRRASLAEGVRRTLVAPLPRWDSRASLSVGVDAWALNGRLLRASLSLTGGWSCQLRAPSLSGNDRAVLRRTMETAAGARVDGILQRWGEYSERTSASWRFRALGQAPWRPEVADSIRREMREALLWRAARVDDGVRGSDFAERAERAAAWEGCLR